MRVFKISDKNFSDEIIEPQKYSFYLKAVQTGRIQWVVGNYKIFINDEIGTLNYVLDGIFNNKKTFKIRFSIQYDLENDIYSHVQVSLWFMGGKIATWKSSDDSYLKSNDFNAYLSDVLGFGVLSFNKSVDKIKKKIEYDKSVESAKKDMLYFEKRMTRRSLPILEKQAAEVVLVCRPIKDEGHFIGYKFKNLESGDEKELKVLMNRNPDGSAIDKKRAIDHVDRYILEFRGYNFVDEKSSDYIPEGVNADNWDFGFNTWKKDLVKKDVDEDVNVESRNRNWYKMAKEEDWYNWETALRTEDPVILTKILKKGKDDGASRYAAQNYNCPPEILAEVIRREKDDDVSCYAAGNPNCQSEVLTEVIRREKDDNVSKYAARNPNCPSEILVEILRRGNDDEVSWSAAENPNCPPEALAEVLRRGKIDWVSRCAAYNKNCPPEALAEVLKEGYDDYVSWNAAENPNCPPKAKIEWLEATGQLTKYDPEKHELEHSEEDKDLEELRKLMGKGYKNMKTSQYYDYGGYFTGDVPESAVNYLGTLSVDASQIKSMFSRGGDAIDLVNRFDSSLLQNVSFIFNFGKSGAYGVYLSEMDRAIKTKALQKKLEQKGYEIQLSEKGLTAFPKQGQNITNEQVQGDIDAIYRDLESKGGSAIGVNMNSIISASKSDAMAMNSKDPNVWEWITVLHLGGTIVHEAVHAKGARDEGAPSAAEASFVQWALPLVNQKYAESMKGSGKEDAFAPLVVSTEKRHAKNRNWYKTAQDRMEDRMEDWYDYKTAWKTKDPEVLAKILRKGLDDYVSFCAAQNPNCPSEVLAEVLKREKNNWVSRTAISNPNCPPKAILEWYEATGQLTKYDPEKHELEKVPEDKDLEELRKLMGKNRNWYRMAQDDWYNLFTAKNSKDPEILAKILKKGNVDYVSAHAATNFNCPPEALTEVLRRGKDDYVSRNAANNPNCPSEVLAEVLRRGNNDDVSQMAAKNNRCPPETLIEILKRKKDDVVSMHAAYNPNCPLEALAEVLRRGNNDDVSQMAAFNPNCPPKERLDWLDATGKLTKYDPEKFELEKVPEDKDLEELRKLMGKNRNWYKTAQYYVPEQFRATPMGSDLSGRHPDIPISGEGLGPWAKTMQYYQNAPIETKLGRQFMSPLPKDLDQNKDSTEEQLRKYTRDIKRNPSNATMEELLSEGHDKDRGYRSTEELLDEKRVKPLMVPLEKTASKTKMKKEATLFGWMNNLEISDGSTIPGLSDRVMLWEDRDESFSEEESWIRKQPRYNPEYDIKGFYYRWIEPRFRPELFDDMTRDYSNTHPAKRFAKKNESIGEEWVTIIRILKRAKEQILKNKISTRFVATEDIIPLIDKIFNSDDFRIYVFEIIDFESEEKAFSIWVAHKDVDKDKIEKVEKCMQKIDEEEHLEELLKELLGSCSKKELDGYVSEIQDICKEKEIEDISIEKSDDAILCKGGWGNGCYVVGEKMAEKHNVDNIRTSAKNMKIGFILNGIDFIFKSK